MKNRGPLDTDYDIPKIGYRSALYFLLASLFCIFIIPQLGYFKSVFSFIAPLILGVSIPFGEKNRKFNRNFFIKTAIISSVFYIFLFLFFI